MNNKPEDNIKIPSIEQIREQQNDIREKVKTIENTPLALEILNTLDSNLVFLEKQIETTAKAEERERLLKEQNHELFLRASDFTQQHKPDREVSYKDISREAMSEVLDKF